MWIDAFRKKGWIHFCYLAESIVKRCLRNLDVCFLQRLDAWGGQENGMMGNIISFLLHQTQGPPVRKISEIINFEDRFIKGTPGSLYKQSDVGTWGWHVYMDPTAPCVVIHKYSCFIDHDKHCSPLMQCLSVGQRKLYNQQKSKQIWYLLANRFFFWKSQLSSEYIHVHVNL